MRHVPSRRSIRKPQPSSLPSLSQSRLLPSEHGSIGSWRFPAEWEPHAATWLAWPHRAEDWPGKMAAIHWVYGEIVRKLVDGEQVRILVNSALHEKRARRVLERVGVDRARYECFRIPTNRSWTRDYGPMFLECVEQSGTVAIVDFRFNGWARYPDWQKDDAVPRRVAARLNLPVITAMFEGRHVVLEGGSIDVNGRGTLITTEECLLDTRVQARNPELTKRDLERIFRSYLGATNVIWLGRGICGDDTHGHVDDVCRFVGARKVVLCREENPRDENYHALAENAERLADARDEAGEKIEVIPLPMPAPLYFDGQRLPASYANFYIGNTTVLVPTFNDPHDRNALGILADIFPDRVVVGIHAVDLVWGLGTIHCLTQQQPCFGAHQQRERS
ncbi:MAG: agmatine deiminase family protein [Nitrospirae bacterium]|nr:MAG: agmatine deiminase family protein [Nitrospirota bacterium]